MYPECLILSNAEMLVNNPENEKLFAKTVPVSLRDDYTNQTRTTHLFLTVEWQDASAEMFGRKVLVISLTDNNDPFFLYNLHLSEEDFQMLKTEQQLLINFASFPQHIISYIEKCLFEEKNHQSSKFLLVFTINGNHGSVAPSKFEIIETNQLRNLIHLSLQFVGASESTIKQYISTCFRNLKEANKKLQNNLSFSEEDKKDKVAALEHALNNKEQELESLRQQKNAELARKDSMHSQELQEERNRFHEKLKEEQNRYDRERKDKDHHFRKEIQQLESNVQILDNLKKELEDKNSKNESTIRDLKSNALKLENEIRRLKDNIQSYRLKNDNLQSELKDKQSHIRSLDETILDLQDEIRSKAQSITRLNQQIESEIKQKNSLEAEIEHVKLQLDMSEKTRKILDKDKDELNEIIINLQDKARKSKSKIELAAKYKQQLEEKEKVLQDVKKEIADLNLQLESKHLEINSLKGSINTIEEKNDSLEKDVKNKASIIKWMHSIITEHGIIPRYTPQSNLDLSPSSIAQQQLAKISGSVGQTSQSPVSSPPVIASNRTTSKSLSADTPSPIYGKGSSIPRRFNRTPGNDSAYVTSPSGYSNQMIPDNLYGHNKNFHQDQEVGYDIDPEALNAAFGQGEPLLKHSTAKKPTKPVKSTTTKVSKKR